MLGWIEKKKEAISEKKKSFFFFFVVFPFFHVGNHACAVSGVANSRIGRTPFQTVRDLITAPKLYGDYLARIT